MKSCLKDFIGGFRIVSFKKLNINEHQQLMCWEEDVEKIIMTF